MNCQHEFIVVSSTQKRCIHCNIIVANQRTLANGNELLAEEKWIEQFNNAVGDYAMACQSAPKLNISGQWVL